MGIRPAPLMLCSLLLCGITANAVPTIYVIGDSTAKNLNARGWGDPLASFFDPAKVTVVNSARAGRSSRTFLTEGLWQKVADELKPGDIVLIQFGHNDAGPLDTGRARGSLPGIGSETRDVTTPDGKQETVHTYGWYLRSFISGTKAKDATPIILTLTVRNIWHDGKVERGSGQFNAWASEVARAGNVPLVDVTSVIADRYDRMGERAVKAFFPEDYAHTSPEGAEWNANAVVAGLKALHGNLFGGYFSPKGIAVDPARDRGVVLIGDSTVRNGRGDGRNGQWGWGEPLSEILPNTPVINSALGGRSSRTFLTGGNWYATLAVLKAGDVVLMQFGHNDSGPLDDTARARGTLPGTGEESREIDNPITQKHETVYTYGHYLRQFIRDCRSRGTVPVVCSPIPRNMWKDGKVVRSPYAKWAAEVAAAEQAPFLDLETLIIAQYEQLGAEKAGTLFESDHTHTNRAGAELNAQIVGAWLRRYLESRR